MAPTRPRYSIKSYAGKRRAKVSIINVVPPEEDPFEKLTIGVQKQLNIFESSSERENSANSRSLIPVSLSDSCRLQSSPAPFFYPRKTGSGNVTKKRSSTTMYNETLKKCSPHKILETCSSSALYQMKCSTPKLQLVSRSLRSSGQFSSSHLKEPRESIKRLNFVEISPIARKTLLDTGQDSFGSEKSFSFDEPSKREALLSPLPEDLKNHGTSREESDKIHDVSPGKSSNMTSDRKVSIEASPESEFDADKEESDISQENQTLGVDLVSQNEFDSTNSPSVLKEKVEVEVSGSNLDCSSLTASSSFYQSPVENETSQEDSRDSLPEAFWNLQVSDDSPRLLKSGIHRAREGMRRSERPYMKMNQDCGVHSRSSFGKAEDKQSPDDVDIWQQDYIKSIGNSQNDNLSPGSAIRINVEENDEFIPTPSTVPSSALSSKSDSYISMRKRRSLNHCRRPHVNDETPLDAFPHHSSGEEIASLPSERRPDWLTAPLHGTSRSRHSSGSEANRRRIYQRLSRSLPAWFKDGGSAFGRGCISDVDPRKSVPVTCLLLSSSTRSLPAVLEDQDLELNTDEEIQSSNRSGFPFRKSSLDQSASPFYGFSEVSRRKRNFIIKKHSEDSASTSPHTLPVLPENDSDTSCDSGDDSKPLESGSSSQVESPVMSPGVLGSPSKLRDTSSVSSSRSDGLISPLLEDNTTPPRSSSPEPPSEDESPSRREEQAKRRRPSRLASRGTLGYIAEESELDATDFTHYPKLNQKPLHLIAGKKYKRSLIVIRNKLISDDNSNLENKGKSYLETVDTVRQLQKDDTSSFLDSDDSLDLSPDSRRSQLFSRLHSDTSDAEDSSSNPDMRSSTVLNPRRTTRYSCAMYYQNYSQVDVSTAARRLTIAASEISCLDNSTDETISSSEDHTEKLILQLCKLHRCVEFSEMFADGSLSTWRKIGEGVYSEVFCLERENCSPTVLKIIPVEGDIIVNGCNPMSLQENITEIFITLFLSRLRDGDENACEGFVELVQVWYVQGQYPDELIKLWHDFNEQFGSDNDIPTIFPENQKYLCLELANSGKALESYSFTSAKQSFSIFKQVVFSLAVAERALEFEHRDLHWGNILVDKTNEKSFDFILDGQVYRVLTNGLKASIIDYTWSSLTYKQYDDLRLINDMEKDPDLFAGTGDLQFDVYRQMRADVEQDWCLFRPKTNVRWLHYLADKLINKSKYMRPSTGTHKAGIASFQKILDIISSCDSSFQLAIELAKFK